MDTTDSSGPPGLTAFNHNVTRWCRAQGLPDNLWNTLRILAYNADKDTWRHIWSVDKMAAYSRTAKARKLGITDVSRATLYRHLNQLEKLGLVERASRTRPTDHRRTSNEYALRFDRVSVDDWPAQYDFQTGEITPFERETPTDLHVSDVSAGQKVYQTLIDTPGDTPSDLRIDTPLTMSHRCRIRLARTASGGTGGQRRQEWARPPAALGPVRWRVRRGFQRSCKRRWPPRVRMQESFSARAHLVTVLGSTLNRAATSPGVINSGSWPLPVPLPATAARRRYPAGAWSVLVMARVSRRVSRSSAAMIWVRWPSWLTATHAELGSRCSTCHWPPKSAMIAASLPVSYPCRRSCRSAGTVPAVKASGGAGGGRRCAAYPWEVLLICHRPPNSPSRAVRLAASSPVMPGVVSGIVIPLGLAGWWCGAFVAGGACARGRPVRRAACGW
jgi:hypothetical protein